VLNACAPNDHAASNDVSDERDVHGKLSAVLIWQEEHTRANNVTLEEWRNHIADFRLLLADVVVFCVPVVGVAWGRLHRSE